MLIKKYNCKFKSKVFKVCKNGGFYSVKKVLKVSGLFGGLQIYSFSTGNIFDVKNGSDVDILVEGLKTNGNDSLIAYKAMEQEKQILAFYTKIMSFDPYLEKGLDKKPLQAARNREVSMSLQVVSDTIKRGVFDIRFSFGSEKEVFTVYDFDLHKISDVDLRWHYFRCVCNFALENDLTLVLSPRLGLHLYFDFDKNNVVIGKTRSIDRILKCLIPNVDILTSGSFIGPGNNRPLLHLSGRWRVFGQTDLFVVPAYMFPLGDGKDIKSDLKMLSTLPDSIDKLIKVGCRRRCLLELYKKTALTTEDIISINKYFFYPPKSMAELKTEVIDVLPKLLKKSIGTTGILEIKNLGHILCYDNITNNFLVWNDSYKKWEPKGYNDIVKILVDFLGDTEDFYYKRKSFVVQAIIDELDIRKLKVVKVDNFLLTTECNQVVNLYWTDGQINYEIISDIDRIKNNYLFKTLNHKVRLEELDLSINYLNANSGDSFLSLVQIICPNVFGYLKSKFIFDSDELNNSFSLLLIRVILFVFLKNFDIYKNLTVQKFVLLFGHAGSGKSAVMKLIQEMVPSYDLYNGSFSTLGGRFETGFMVDKILHCFSDEDVMSLLGKDVSVKVNVFKKLTSGIDSIRVEKKFGGVSSFVNKGLVLITSNNVNIVDTESDYGAMTRRSICVPFFKTINAEKQNSNVVTEILNKDFSALAVLSFFVTSNIDDFKKTISTFDTGRETTRFEEFKSYENFCDPYANFLELIVEADTHRSQNTFISWKHFSCLYLQYIIFRKGSTIEVNNVELLIEQFNHYMKDYSYGSGDGLKGDLAFFTKLFKEGIVIMKTKTKLFSLESNAICLLFTERLPFLIKKLKLVNETLDRDQIDSLGKKYTTRVSGFRGLLLRKSCLKEMSVGFSFVGEKTKLDNNVFENKWCIENETNCAPLSLQIAGDSHKKIKVRNYSTRVCSGDSWVTKTNSLIQTNLAELIKNCNGDESLIGICSNVPLLHYNYPIEKVIKVDDTEKVIRIEDNPKVLGLVDKEKLLENNYLQKNSMQTVTFQKFGFRFDSFPELIRELLIRVTVECLYYQNISNAKCNHDQVFLYLNPFFQKVHDTVFMSEAIKDAYMQFKINKLLVNELNLSKRKISAEIKKLNSGATKILILDVLASFISEGYKLKTIGTYSYEKRQNVFSHVLFFNNITKKELSHAVMHLSTKPMLCQPNSWVLDDKKNMINGGYLINVNKKAPIYHNKDIHLKAKITFCEKYCDSINELQKQKYILSLELVEFSIKNWLDYHFAACKEQLITCLDRRKTHGKITYFKLSLLKGLINRLNTFVYELQNLVFLCTFEDFDKGLLTLFFPIHIDRIGRMYNWGSLNVVNSKFFRHCLIDANSNKIFYDLNVGKQQEKIMKRIEKIDSNIDSNIDIVFLRYYKNMLLKSSNSYLFLDATSSMLQIYSLLFADLNIAISTNLSVNCFDPVVEISSKWIASQDDLNSFKNWKHLVTDRFFLKWIILYKLYGASYLSIKKYMKEKMQENDPENYSNGYSGLTFAIKWAIVNIETTFDKLFVIKKMFNKKKFDNITLCWQGNKTDYCYYKKSDLTLDITKVTKMQDDADLVSNGDLKKVPLRKRLHLSWNDYMVVDKNANVRTVFTGILHSLDASVALTTRIAMREKYGVNVYSVHDSFAVPIAYGNVLKVEFKEALFKCVFDARLIDIIKVEGIDFTRIQKDIDCLKKDERWKNIRNSYSDFCLKVE